jgi:hypothetical protein
MCFYKYLEKVFSYGNVQLHIDNILNYHNVVKLVHISTIQLSIGIHFKFAIVCHKQYNVRKGLRNISFNWNFSIKLCRYKKK